MAIGAKKKGKKKSESGLAGAEDRIDNEAKEAQTMEDSLDGGSGGKLSKKKSKGGSGKSSSKRGLTGKRSSSTSLGGSNVESEELASTANDSEEMEVEGTYLLTEQTTKTKKTKEKKSKDKASTKSTASKKTKKIKKKRKSENKNDDFDVDDCNDEDPENVNALLERNSSMRTPDKVKENKRKSEKRRSERKQSIKRISKSETLNNQEQEDRHSEGEVKDNAPLQEIYQLRKQLKQAKEDLEMARRETAAAMEKAEKGTNQLAREKHPPVSSAEWTQIQLDFNRSKDELADLRSEMEEYEEAVQEKDGLIKQLTEAMDCQLDKVEYLELKLQRAEDEFCKMENEMKDLEEELEDLKFVSITESTTAIDARGDDPLDDELRSLEGSSVGNFEKHKNRNDLLTKEERHGRGTASTDLVAAQSPSSVVTLRQLPDAHRKYVEDMIQKVKFRETELTKRESDLYMREQNVLKQERDMDGREKEILQETEMELENEMDMIRMKELRLKEREREMKKLEEDLANQEHELEERELDLEDALKHGRHVNAGEENHSFTENSHDTRQISKIRKLTEQVEDLRLENEDLRHQIYQDEEDATDLVEDLESQINDLQEALEEMQNENDELREKVAQLAHQLKIQKQRDYEAQMIQDDINQELQDLDDENKQLRDTIRILEEENDSIRGKKEMRRRYNSSSKSNLTEVESDQSSDC